MLPRSRLSPEGENFVVGWTRAWRGREHLGPTRCHLWSLFWCLRVRVSCRRVETPLLRGSALAVTGVVCK